MAISFQNVWHLKKSMWADMIDDDAAGDGELARGCEGSMKKKVVIKKGEGCW